MHQARGKWAFPEMIREINKAARSFDVDAIIVEDKGSGISYIQTEGRTENQPRKAPAPVIGIKVPPNQGKLFRWEEITPMIEEGSVYLPAKSIWTDGYIRQCSLFPDGAHDDQVDATSQALRYFKSKRTRYGTKKVSGFG